MADTSSSAQAAPTHTAPAAQTSPQGAPAPQGKQDINGVPKDYMRNNEICMKFNDVGGCPEAATHENRFKKGQTLRHICGGCHKKFSKAENAHAATGCSNGPFSSLFR